MLKVTRLPLLLFLVFNALTGCTAGFQIGSENPNSIATDSRDEGDWESSGGAGVACFSTPEAAQKYDQAIQNKDSLSDEIVSSIQTLVTLEKWELGDKKLIEGDSASILKFIREKLKFYSALFAYKLSEVEKRIGVGQWTKDTTLTLIDDAKPMKPVGDEMSPNCRLIQLAVRYTKHDKLEKIPPVHVSFDPRLWAKLSEVDRAILTLHEQIYLIGKQSGHNDARYTRQLVEGFIRAEFWESSSPENQAIRTQNLINASFGDYIHVLFEAVPLPEHPEPNTQISRYMSFRSLIKKMRAVSDPCNQQGAKPGMSENEEEALHSRCNYLSLKEANDANNLTPEEAYLFFYRWVITFELTGIPNSEIVIVDWQDSDFQKLVSKALSESCKNIVPRYFMSMESQGSEDALEKAAHYCQQLPK